MNNAINCFSKSWLVHHIFNKELQKIAVNYASGRLIDVGCGEKPYKEIFAPYIIKHIGVDHSGCLHDRSNIDLYGIAYDLPILDQSFDTLLSTAVLEHLEEPEKAISEAARVLRKGGIAIYSVPLFWHIHEPPRDFFRFTRYGLQYLFEKNGFEILILKELSGFWVTFVTEFLYYLEWLFERNPVRHIVRLFGVWLQLVALFLNQFDKSRMFTWAYLVVARKK